MSENLPINPFKEWYLFLKGVLEDVDDPEVQIDIQLRYVAWHYEKLGVSVDPDDIGSENEHSIYISDYLESYCMEYYPRLGMKMQNPTLSEERLEEWFVYELDRRKTNPSSREETRCFWNNRVIQSIESAKKGNLYSIQLMNKIVEIDLEESILHPHTKQYLLELVKGNIRPKPKRGRKKEKFITLRNKAITFGVYLLISGVPKKPLICNKAKRTSCKNCATCLVGEEFALDNDEVYKIYKKNKPYIEKVGPIVNTSQFPITAPLKSGIQFRLVDSEESIEKFAHVGSKWSIIKSNDL